MYLRHAPPLLALALIWVSFIHICSLIDIHIQICMYDICIYGMYTCMCVMHRICLVLFWCESSTWICEHMYGNIIVYKFLRIDMYVSVYSCFYTDMYACMYAGVCIYIYILTWICIHAHNDTTSACSCSETSHLHTYISVRYISKQQAWREGWSVILAVIAFALHI